MADDVIDSEEDDDEDSVTRSVEDCERVLAAYVRRGERVRESGRMKNEEYSSSFSSLFLLKNILLFIPRNEETASSFVQP